VERGSGGLEEFLIQVFQVTFFLKVEQMVKNFFFELQKSIVFLPG